MIGASRIGNYMPRVAHLNFIDEPGVIRKLREEARTARMLGLPIDFYVIDAEFKDHDEEHVFYRQRRSAPLPGKLRFLYSMLFEREDIISNYVDPNAYDFFVIRFGKLFLGQGSTYKKWGRRIVTEHHTDEMMELLLKPSLGRRLLASVSARRSVGALERVAGLVAVTEEILAVEKKKAGEKPGLVLPNGISVPNEVPPPRLLKQGETLRLVFAAAAFQPWQGLDRLLAGLEKYTGIQKVELDLAGKLDAAQRELVHRLDAHQHVKINMLGLLTPVELRERYAQCHIGIAGQALFRNGLKEACPLKAREYAAWGLPFIYAYDDPDFPDNWPYALKLSPDESPVDIDAVVRFAQTLYANGDPTVVMHAFARDYLDWKRKLSQLYKFIVSLAGDSLQSHDEVL